MIQHRVVIKKISELLPAPYNPRKISESAMKGLTASIQKFGIVQDPLYNRRTGFVVGGHQRIAVLKNSGVKTVRCIEVDLSEAEELALNITLNSSAVAGEFTDDLQALLDQLHSATPDLIDPLQLNDLWNGSAYAQGEPQTGKEETDVMIKCPKCKHRFTKK